MDSETLAKGVPDRQVFLEQALAKLILSGEIMADALNQSKVRAHIRTQWYDTLKTIKGQLAELKNETNPVPQD